MLEIGKVITTDITLVDKFMGISQVINDLFPQMFRQQTATFISGKMPKMLPRRTTPFSEILYISLTKCHIQCTVGTIFTCSTLILSSLRWLVTSEHELS